MCSTLMVDLANFSSKLSVACKVTQCKGNCLWRCNGKISVYLIVESSKNLENDVMYVLEITQYL